MFLYLISMSLYLTKIIFGEHYTILKPGMAHYQYSIENECFCMMLAKAVDLNVPLVKIVQKDTQKVLVIKRYFLKTKIPVKSAL